MPDYPIVQTAVYDVLLKLADYNVDNGAEDDYRILGNAGIAKGVVLTRGNSGNSQSGQQDILGGDRLRFVRRDDWVVSVVIRTATGGSEASYEDQSRERASHTLSVVTFAGDEGLNAN